MTSALTNDEITLYTLASGLVKLDSRLEGTYTLQLPYNLSLTRGLNRLTLRAIEQKIAPPKSLWDFVDLANQPLSQWYLTLPDTLLEMTLLEDDYLSETCLELAALAQGNPDVEAELTEAEVILEALSAARNAASPELYSAFRHFIIRKPVIFSFDLQRLSPELRLLKSTLVKAYGPVPVVHQHRGTFWRCERCGDLLQKTRDAWRCDARCRPPRTSPSEVGAPIQTKDSVLRLKRGMRQYVFKPGLAELGLATKLEKLGVNLTLWPNYDAYDLLLRFADGEAWAVDVKDWKNPYLLAQRALGLPREPEYDRAFFVFPDRRKTSHYLSTFKRHSTLAPNTSALFAKDFLRRVKRKVNGA